MAMAGATPTTVSKLFLLAAQRGVLSGRGSHALLCGAAGIAMTAQGDFDALAAGMPNILQAARNPPIQHLDPISRAEFRRGLAAKQEISLAGWSPAERRLIAWLYTSGDGEQGWSRTEITDTMLGPDLPDVWPETAEDLVDVARQQRDLCRSKGLVGIGGEIRVCTITRDEIAIRVMCDLDAPALVHEGVLSATALS